MRTRRRPAAPVARRRFSGWRIVAFASVTYALTAPGQTIGVSVFVDPMIRAAIVVLLAYARPPERARR